jgi:hypothetical protein
MTAEEIDAAKTPRGGWTKATLAKWGVTWPPLKGWRKRLLAEGPCSSEFERQREQSLWSNELERQLKQSPSKLERVITLEELESCRTEKGGYRHTKALLASWGVTYPPPKGWRSRLLKRALESEAERGESRPRSADRKKSGNRE